MHRTLPILASAIVMSFILGCSGGTPATSPGTADYDAAQASAGSHHCWGYWRMAADPDAQTLDITALRGVASHLNVLPLLEPPPFVYLSLEHLEFLGSGELIADIGLRHPFLGLTEFTGFDVCGVLVTNGGATFGETGLTYAAGANDTHLTNYDGLTRWWNPDDFPPNGTIFRYKDGMLGTPDSVANYNTDLNAYKYYSDELGLNNDILECTPARRGMFSAGAKNIRRFHIHLGTDGLVFNYAVDANWEFPTGGYPWTAPDDFGENANRPEAWAINVAEIENTLYNDGSDSGGNLSLSIDVYDHFNAGMNTVRVQSPGNFDSMSTSTPTGGGEGYSTYQVDIIDATPAWQSILIYFIIESEAIGYAGNIPGQHVSAYFTVGADVSSEPPGCVIHVDDDNQSGPWDGSSAHPYKLLQDAVNVVPDDCKILVHPGQYDEDGQVTISGITDLIIEGIDSPVIHPPHNTVDGKAAIKIPAACPNLVIDGLEILANDAYEAAFWLTNAHDITIKNCLITPTTTPGFNYAILASNCNNLTIEGCTFDKFNSWSPELKLVHLTNCDGAAVTLNTCLELNTSAQGTHHTTESFVYLTTCTNCEVSKNRFGKHQRTATAPSGGYVHGYYIGVAGGSGNVIRNNLLYDLHVQNSNFPNSYNYGIYLRNGPTNLEIYNNTIDNMGPTKPDDDSGGTYGIIDFGGGSGSVMYNNIVTNLYHYRGSVGIYAYSGEKPTYNCVWNMTSVSGTNFRYLPPGCEGEGDLDANPMYTDPAAGDYTLQPGSPCINAGRIGGTSSGDPTDMGCHGGADPLPE